ncbi:hypothetical protein [Pseudarthrobacter niigatensis]|uniref:Uncharacterized protein n=1 Tax=Pseudarthrobacter niigatensis TaxID=369935 RepID=A0AAJ1SUH5_9MICC|nr:hypothetical protein [Pseudarthrobacter niigatensis]MDQ0145954.1 hypothetical protein [Pseudarthrobacter niigatensis]MDQ0266318.1 hypothetical protein [Pseudarthrobacter niigatensis]
MTAPFRVPRAIAFTAAMLTLAAGAHLLAGGILPPPVILAGIVALVLAPVTILSKTKINAPAMTGLLGSSQLALHWAFDALSVSATFTPADGAHGHGALPASSMAAVLAPGHAAVPGALMLALHAVATVATALVLARGEAAVWALAAWLRPLVRILAAVAIPEWPHIAAPAAVVIPFRWRNLRLPALRGPPSFHAAL